VLFRYYIYSKVGSSSTLASKKTSLYYLSSSSREIAASFVITRLTFIVVLATFR
jgi:hypothetical protein